jgi:hypothetical protein
MTAPVEGISAPGAESLGNTSARTKEVSEAGLAQWRKDRETLAAALAVLEAMRPSVPGSTQAEKMVAKTIASIDKLVLKVGADG